MNLKENLKEKPSSPLPLSLSHSSILLARNHSQAGRPFSFFSFPARATAHVGPATATPPAQPCPLPFFFFCSGR
jgi:hypothetical protein